MMDGIEQKIDTLTVMMGKLVTKDKEQNRQFKLQVCQINSGRGQTEMQLQTGRVSGQVYVRQ